MDNTNLLFVTIPLFKKEDHLMHSLNQYGITTALTYPIRSEPEVIAKFKDGTIWLIRIINDSRSPQQLSLASVFDSMSLYDKAKNLNATPVLCSIQAQEMKAHFYHISGRGPFAHLSLASILTEKLT